jgi:topoisomerase-4 subunit A
MNGASGIAVGMATEIPPHNLRELANVCADLVVHPDRSDDEILQQIPGPDFPGGAQIISTPEQIREAYLSGRGSIRVRARWDVEKLSRGEWRIVIHQLPPGVSTAQIMTEIEGLSNPQPKGDGKKKALSPEQQNIKNVMLSQIESVRDESGKENSVRIVIEPCSRNQDPQNLMTWLLARTSLESNQSVNLTVLDLDGKAPCLPLAQILRQWVSYRVTTVRRRCQFRLDRTMDRIHILEGRLRVLLDIDTVIHLIRESDDPRSDLISRIGLSEVQADDILEIRLRQLARLSGIEMEKELDEKRKTAASLDMLLQNEKKLRSLIAKEIAQDAEKYGDDRRTILEADTAITQKSIQSIGAAVTDEAVTVIVSKKGWLRTRSGHGLDLSGLGFKDGDSLLRTFEVRTVDTLVLLDDSGRAYSIAVTSIPGGRGDGIPASSQIDLPAGRSISCAACGSGDSLWLIAGNSGYGFVTALENMTGRNRAGKAFLTLNAGEKPLPPVAIGDTQAEVFCLSSKGHGLLFPLSEIKQLPKGKGVKLMALESSATLQSVGLFFEGQELPTGLRKNRVDVCRGHRGGRGRTMR